MKIMGDDITDHSCVALSLLKFLTTDFTKLIGVILLRSDVNAASLSSETKGLRKFLSFCFSCSFSLHAQ